jgi:2'-5' RNA ligase superfamily
MTTLVVPVPEAERAVAHWRKRYDWSASLGVPAHVTVLGPFLPPDRIGTDVIDRLSTLCSRLPRVKFRLTSVVLLEGVTCLTPDPDEPFRAMSEVLEAEWPEAAPGAHGRRMHLTVARDISVFETIGTELAEVVPIEAEARELVLLEAVADSRVREVGRFAFRGLGGPQSWRVRPRTERR